MSRDPLAEAAGGIGESRAFAARLGRRYGAERRFRLYGLIAILISVGALATLLITIVGKGAGAFVRTEIALSLTLDAEAFGDGTEAALSGANYGGMVKQSLYERFPSVTERREKRALAAMVSRGADLKLRDMVIADPGLIGERIDIWVPASSDIDMLTKGQISRDVPQQERRINDLQIGWYDDLTADGAVRRSFNSAFFTSSDSRDPERAGILGAAVGSMWTMLVCLLIAVPLAVMTAIYLEEFAPQNRWTDLIEVNINNLAAVPSIVFGLLGLAVFLSFFGVPRSAPLVGGLVLALMTLPTVFLAARAALRSVPPSIRNGALGIGASRTQAVIHHVLPVAMPGILTGTIIGMAQALGETAPLLMIGMVAFIVDVPSGPLDAATAMPVQIFLWADSPERGFIEKTSGAIIVLLAILIAMNAVAIYLRKRFERQW